MESFFENPREKITTNSNQPCENECHRRESSIDTQCLTIRLIGICAFISDVLIRRGSVLSPDELGNVLHAYDGVGLLVCKLKAKRPSKKWCSQNTIS